MNIAILGFEQAGKRTLFSLLTRRAVPEGRGEDDILEGQAAIRDARVDTMVTMVRPKKWSYAEMPCMLCPDLREGTGRRPWLEAARRCDVLCMVVRAFASEAVYHPQGSVDPVRDQAMLKNELLLADLELIETRLERLAKEKRAGQSDAQVREERILARCREAVESEVFLADIEFQDAERDSIKSLSFLTLKPILWLWNVDESGAKENHDGSLRLACLLEKEIAEIDDPAERAEYLDSMGLESSGSDRFARAVCDAAGRISFFTVGPKEVRAWQVIRGAAAPRAAGKVHSDMERGFIRVEVLAYEDFKAAGSEAAAREQGKMQLKGKDYIVQDGDICIFRFNV